MSPEFPRPPHPRHFVRHVTQRSWAKSQNTVILSSVNVPSDLAAIRRGEATWDGSTYEVAGRVYGVEQAGRLYPIMGVGFMPLDRGGYRALGVYNRFDLSARASDILDAMEITEDARAAARRVYEAERGLP